MRATSLILAAIAALAPASARPCSCRFPTSGVAAPADGASDVPRNAKIWLGGMSERSGASLPVLVDAAGQQVPVVATTIADVLILSPVATLEPGQRHAVTSDGQPLLAFTTGEDVDDAPPEVPQVLETTATSGFPDPFGTCGTAHFAEMTFRADGHMTVLVREDVDALDPAGLSGDVMLATATSPVRFGRGGCASGWPGAGPLSSTRLRLGSFDVAGNFSGLGDAELIVLPPPGCSCDAAGGARSTSPAGGIAAVVALVAIASLRRAARRR